jgi:hypothetical protein
VSCFRVATTHILALGAEALKVLIARHCDMAATTLTPCPVPAFSHQFEVIPINAIRTLHGAFYPAYKSLEAGA